MQIQVWEVFELKGFASCSQKYLTDLGTDWHLLARLKESVGILAHYRSYL